MGGRPGLSALVAAALLCLLSAVRGGILASSQLQSCVQDGTDTSLNVTCSKKAVVSMTVESNKLQATDSFSLNLRCVDSPSGVCPCPCNYATEPLCKCRDLNETVVVEVTKSPAYYTYPLTYRKQFSGRPYERSPNCMAATALQAIIKYSGWSNCYDNFYGDPSCGFAYFPNNTKVPDSQGFCCTCAMMDSSKQQRRGGLECPLLWGATREWAHCLRIDPAWEHYGYAVDEAQTSFHLNVTLRHTFPDPLSPGNTSTSTEVLTVSPSVVSRVSSTSRIAAKLEGDLAGYQQSPQLAGHWLFVPTQGKTRQEQHVAAYKYRDWLLVPPTMVTADGTQCDKVGSSYTAFRSGQANACFMPEGSCLRNSISDLWTEDEQLIATGRTPLYRLQRYGGGSDAMEQGKVEGSKFLMQLPIRGITKSLVTLTMDAGDLTFVTKTSPAEVVQAKVCTYDNKTCGGFESMAARGYLFVDVKNKGYADAGYTVGITNCTAGILPITAQYSSIPAQGTKQFAFEIRMATQDATNSSCAVLVSGDLGTVASTKNFTFYTNETIIEPPPTQSDPDDEFEDPNGPRKGSSEWCADQCNLFNVVCSAKNACFGRLAKGIGAIAGPAAGILGILVAARTGYLSIAFKAVSWLLCPPRNQQPLPPKDGKGGEAKGGSAVASKGDRRRSTAMTSSEEEGDAVVTLSTAGRGSKAALAAEPPGGALQRSNSLQRAQELLAAIGMGNSMRRLMYSNPFFASQQPGSSSGGAGGSGSGGSPYGPPMQTRALLPPVAPIPMLAPQYAGPTNWLIPAGPAPSPADLRAYGMGGGMPGSPMHAVHVTHGSPTAGHVGAPPVEMFGAAQQQQAGPASQVIVPAQTQQQRVLQLQAQLAQVQAARQQQLAALQAAAMGQPAGGFMLAQQMAPSVPGTPRQHMAQAPGGQLVPAGDGAVVAANQLLQQLQQQGVYRPQ